MLLKIWCLAYVCWGMLVGICCLRFSLLSIGFVCCLYAVPCVLFVCCLFGVVWPLLSVGCLLVVYRALVLVCVVCFEMLSVFLLFAIRGSWFVTVRVLLVFDGLLAVVCGCCDCCCCCDCCSLWLCVVCYVLLVVGCSLSLCFVRCGLIVAC